MKIIMLSAIIALIFIIIVVAIYWAKKNNPHEKIRLAFNTRMVDENNKSILKTIKVNNNKFEENFLIQASSNLDIYFDVILINNFKQVEFSINGDKTKKKHQIFIPKTSEKNFLKSKIVITTNNVEEGLNDAALIFTIKTKDSSSLKRSPIKKTFITRFGYYKESSNKEFNHSYASDYKIINGELDLDMLVFDKPFNKIESNHFENYTNLSSIDRLKVGEKTKLNIYINLKHSIVGSPFYDKYLQDEKLNIKQTFALLALLDGEPYPLYYSDSKEENVKFYGVQLGKSIMITPELKIIKKGIHRLTLIALSYPYSNQEKLLGSYKITNWSTEIVSQEVPINVIE